MNTVKPSSSSVSSQLESSGAVFPDFSISFFPDFSIEPCWHIEHATNVVVYLLRHTFLWNMHSDILLKMKLVSLPRNRICSFGQLSDQHDCRRRSTSVYEKSLGVQRLQELTPIHLCFRELHTHAQHAAATAHRDSVRNQQGTVHHRIILATDFFVPGVQQQIFDGFQQ